MVTFKRTRKKKKTPVRLGRRKKCYFCVNRIDDVDYKDIDLLKRYVTDRGKIMSRRVTGACARHQRSVVCEVKKARSIALLPYIS